MADFSELAKLGILAILCFLAAFYFFNKIMKIDKDGGKSAKKWTDDNYINAISLASYEKKWMVKEPSVITGLYKNNMLLKAMFEEGVVEAAFRTGEEGEKDVADILTVAEYFKHNSPSQIKIKNKLDELDAPPIVDFNEKALNYMIWFLEKYSDIDALIKEFDRERELIIKYKGVKGVKRRSKMLELYIMTLKEASSHVLVSKGYNDNIVDAEIVTK